MTKKLSVISLTIWLLITTPITIQVYRLCTTTDFIVWLCLVAIISGWCFNHWFVNVIVIQLFIWIKNLIKWIIKLFRRRHHVGRSDTDGMG